MARILSDNAEMCYAAQLIEEASTIAISGHTNPDGDALGSVLGLALAIVKKFPDKKVTPLLADEGSLPRFYHFLPGSETLQPAASFNDSIELFISVDTPNLERLKNSAEVQMRAKKTIAIDHHPDMKCFGDVNIKVTHACASGLIVLELIDEMKIDLDKDISTCLFTALYTDTGRFQYQNTNYECLSAAAELVLAGAVPEEVSLNIYQSKSIELIALETRVLERISLTCNGKVAISWVSYKDFEETGATRDEAEGLIDLIRAIEGVEVCAMLKEVDDNVVRGSLRSKGEAAIGVLARAIGGGGHNKAAGFNASAPVEEVIRVLKNELCAIARGEIKPQKELEACVASIREVK